MKKANLVTLLLSGIFLFTHEVAHSNEFVVRELPDGGKYYSDKMVIANKYDSPRYLINQVASGIAVSGVASVDELCRQYGVVRIEPFYPGPIRHPALAREIGRLYIFTLAKGVDAADVVDAFATDSHIELAELYSAPELYYTPNDPDIGEQWHLDKIDAYEAWDVVRGDTTRHAVIGIIDTGVYWNHPDLAANIFVNPLEDVNHNGIFDSEDNDGIDSDSNGFVDDVIGWDFGNNDNNPAEGQPIHGTAVAGCASEVTDNNVGGAGIGFAARIMPVKASRNAESYLPFAYQAILYAAENGAGIINCSWGSPTYSQTEQNIIYALMNSGIMLVAGAGGSADTARIYPAAYEGVLAVGATDQNDYLGNFTTYGAWVDVCAPGVNIQSTWGQSNYATLSGTSFSAPLVCGLAALILAWMPDLSVGQVESLIVASADNIDSLNPAIPDSLVPPRLNCANWLTVVSANESELPKGISLSQNYPNPFNAATVIRYVLTAAADIKVEIYDIAGRKLNTLIDSRQDAGLHSARWAPDGIVSGVYFYRLIAGDITETKPMIYMK
jgi:subtilisin family serine protease